ncbi:MAG: Uncharacterised protein [Methanobacteriota archaeon]|nr:MAG: Uncharacterised protein [Euryarchaeota archaeon]
MYIPPKKSLIDVQLVQDTFLPFDSTLFERSKTIPEPSLLFEPKLPFEIEVKF